MPVFMAVSQISQSLAVGGRKSHWNSDVSRLKRVQ